MTKSLFDDGLDEFYDNNEQEELDFEQDKSGLFWEDDPVNFEGISEVFRCIICDQLVCGKEDDTCDTCLDAIKGGRQL